MAIFRLHTHKIQMKLEILNCPHSGIKWDFEVNRIKSAKNANFCPLRRIYFISGVGSND